MPLDEMLTEMNKLSRRDFVRLYLAVTKKFDDWRAENPHLVRSTIFAVKNPEKVQESLQKSRLKARNQKALQEEQQKAQQLALDEKKLLDTISS